MEKQRLSYQEDPLSDGVADGHDLSEAGSGGDRPGTSLQAWRGESLAVDVRRGLVPAAAVPPPSPSPRMEGSLSSRDVTIGMDGPRLAQAPAARVRLEQAAAAHAHPAVEKLRRREAPRGPDRHADALLRAVCRLPFPPARDGQVQIDG